MKNKSWDALPLGCFSSLPNLPALAGSGSVEKLKAKEHGIWSGKNIKASTEKVKPLHIYALMHANIVRLLNE